MELANTLTILFRHHLWANLRLLERCAGLNEEQLESKILGSYGSIRDTLEHIVRAEKSYLSRISTGQPYYHPEDAAPLTLDEMMQWTRETGAGLIDWAPQVQAEDTVEIDWDGTLRQVPKTILLTQALYHATEHRAQVMAILTELGVESPDLQGWQYFDEMDEG